MRPRLDNTATPGTGSSQKRSHGESEVDEAQLSQFQPGELCKITSRLPCSDVVERQYLHNIMTLEPRNPMLPCSGVVERLYLRNFMCHDALEVTFNPRINFVVGRNGSGKSAILLALVVGLGGKASATNRGSSLKDFVKKGEKSALIEVTLNNAGLYPYKREVYGDRITVVRTIAASGGAGAGYKIKSATGAVVSTKREDLNRMMQSLKIQVDNPVAVLNQDTSRNFLNSSDPGDKYTLFMRATQMDVVIIEHNNAIETRAQALVALNEKEEVLAQLEKVMLERKARFKALKSVPDQRRRIEDLENQIVWAQVVDKEAELAAAEAVVAAEERKRDELQRAAEGHGTQDQEMKEQHRALKEQLEEVRRNMATHEARFAEAKAAHNERREAAQAAQRNVQTKRQQVKRQQDNVTALRQEIQRLEQSTGPDYMARRAEQREKSARCEQQLAQAQAALQTSELHMAQLRDNEEPLREQIHAVRSELNEAQRRVDGMERELQSLSRSSNALSLYGAHAVPLQTRIDAAVSRGEFSRPPVGPLGQHVRLREGNAAWACAIEQQLGGHLRSYVVNSAQDRAKLFQLMTEVIGNRRKPTIINSRFQERKHDTARNQVVAPRGSKALLDVIVIDDVQTFNTLVDQAQIEKVLLIPTQDLALTMMKRAETVPRNCARGVLPSGDLYYPAPDFRTYAGQRQYTARYLQVSAADRIRDLEARLAPERASRESCLARVAALDERLAQLRGESRHAAEERTRLKRTIQLVGTKLAQLRDAEEPEVSSISTLAAELVECEEQLAAAQRDEAAALERLAAAVADTDAAKVAAKAIGDEAKELSRSEAPLVESMERIRGDLSASVEAQRYRDERLRERLGAIKEALKAAKAVRAEVAQLVANAERISPRLEPTGPLATLHEKLRRLEAALRSLEEDKGDYVSVGQEAMQLEIKVKTIRAKVESSQRVLKRLGKMIKERAKIYENVRRLVTWVVTHFFHVRLAQRKYTGELDIDHATQKLTITVAPAHRGDGDSSKDTRTLSGGERSYSTVVFIMALWDAVELPFYFMDEFDVFMDKVNRKVIMGMLMEHAKDRFGRQFVFLTPQDIASVATDKDVSIHRMEDPRN